MEKVVNLAKRRGFIFPGSDIYGGLANAWDYGPLGAELKKNIKDEWWQRFVRRRADMVGIDPKIIMNPKVWEASGHIKHFADPLVECKECHIRQRADFLKLHGNSDMPKEKLKEMHWDCPECKKQNVFEPKKFNLLFKTFLGSTEDKASEVYMRGELAQAMFVDFPAVLQTMRLRLPFGIAAQGTVFRNEITPGNFIFRTREFDLMEFEYFTREGDWKQWFDYWLDEMKQWLAHIGVRPEKLYFHEIGDDERAHYSKRTIDIEYDYPFGRKELYGLAYRAAFDLKNHAEKSGAEMRYVDPDTGEKFLPHAIEPTFGLDRTVLVALLEAYVEEEAPTVGEGETAMRTVLKLPYWMTPYKAAVLPLSKKEELTAIAKPLYVDLRTSLMCDYDETQSIGKRYRRQDEIGTPFAITVDFETAKDHAVTVRDRDTMKQERVPITALKQYLHDRLP